MDSSDRIKGLREFLDLSTRAMAEALGVASSVVTNWELGTSAVRKPNALALQALYGVRWEWVMTGDEPMWVGGTSITKHPADAVLVPIFSDLKKLEKCRETLDPKAAQGSCPLPLKALTTTIARRGEHGTPQDLALVVVPWDQGMEPLLHPGGLVLVNTAQAARLSPPQGAIVLLWFNGVMFFRRAYAMSPKPWEDGQLPTTQDAPGSKARTYALSEPTEDAMLGLVKGVVVL